MMLLLVATLGSRFYIERSVWTRHRSSHLWEYIVKQTFNEQDWIENFQMRKAYLCSKLKMCIERKSAHLHQAIPGC